MLKALREGTKSGFLKYILITMMALAVLSLVFIDMSGSFSGGISASSVARVGDTEISTRQFLGRLQQAEHRAGGFDIPEHMREQLALQVADQLVREEVFLTESQDMGLLIRDQIAAKEIKKQLQNLTGNGFTEQEALSQALRSTGLSEGQYIAATKQDIARRRLLEAVTLGSYAPPQMLNTAYKFINQKRSGAYLILPAADFAGKVNVPTQDEITTYHTENISNYMRPEYRQIDYIVFNQDDINQAIDLSDTDLKDIYNDRIDEYTKPVRRITDQVVFKTAEEAQAVVAEAFDHHDLTAALKTVSDDSYILLTDETVTQDDAIADISNGAFNTPIGEIVGPLQTSLGWVVMKVKSEAPSEITPFEDIREALETSYREEVLEDRYYETANEIDDMLASGASLSAISEEFSLTVAQTPLLSLAGQTQQDQKADFMDKNFAEALLTQAFTLQSDELPPLLESEDGTFIAYSVSQIDPKAPYDLDEIRDRVTADWQLAQQKQHMRQMALDIIKSANNGQSLQQAVKQHGKQVTLVKDLTTENAKTDTNVPEAIKQNLYTLKNPMEITQANIGNDLAIIQLTDIIFPEGTSDEDKVADLKRSIREQIRSDLVAQYELALREKYDVNISRNAIKRSLQPQDGAY